MAGRFSTDATKHTPTLYTHRGGQYVVPDGSALPHADSSTTGRAGISFEALSEARVFEPVTPTWWLPVDRGGATSDR